MKDKKIEGSKELKGFLIKRFILIMAGVYVGSELISMLYRNVVLPVLFSLVQQQQITIERQTGIPKVLVGGILYLLLDFLPEGTAGVLREWLGSTMESSLHIHINTVPLTGIWGTFLKVVVFVVFVVLLFITLLPYLVGAFAYYRMVTGKVNELMEQEQEQQKAYVRQRNLLLSDIAHDIKTPLTTICGYSKALSDGIVREEEKRQEYLEAVYAKSMRMSELLTLLFEYVKLDSEGYELHLEKGDFAELVRENTALVYKDFEEKQMELNVELPEEVVAYEMDKLQMGRAVMNLLSNAARYGKTGGRVLVRLEERVLTVADDGMEIEPEFAEHIFEPFSRADKARSTSGGSGLGLSIAARIVEMHGGKLELDCHKMDGYTKAFVLRLEAENK